ncbi:MAG: hypothetical protein K940chlam8_00547 [Chlamydiae bacterium]|nr:hypothetical protein [Chlamydiota bacterium]
MATLAIVAKKPPIFEANKESVTVLDSRLNPMTDQTFAQTVLQCPDLESLIVDVTHFSSTFFDELEKLTKLKTLHLVGKPQAEFFDIDLSLEFRGMETLTIEDAFVDGNMFEAMSRVFPQLRGLYLRSIQVPDHYELLSLKHFKGLQTLSVKEMRLEDSFFAAVEQLEKLETLDLSQSIIGLGLMQHTFPSSLRTLNVQNATLSFFEYTYPVLEERSEEGLSILGMDTLMEKPKIRFSNLPPMPPLDFGDDSDDEPFKPLTLEFV